MKDSLFGAEQGIFRAEQGILGAGTGIRLLDLIPVRFEHLLSLGSWPGLSRPPRLFLLCAVRIRGRRDEPCDDAASDSKRPKSALKSTPAMKRPFRSQPSIEIGCCGRPPGLPDWPMRNWACRGGAAVAYLVGGGFRVASGHGVSLVSRGGGERWNSGGFFLRQATPQEGKFSGHNRTILAHRQEISRFACAFGFTRVPGSSGNCAPSQRIAGRADQQPHPGVWLARLTCPRALAGSHAGCGGMNVRRIDQAGHFHQLRARG
jgi:hypothetical protein